MSSSTPNMLAGGGGSKAKERALRVIQHFGNLPDDAQIDIHVVSHLMSRSISSLWRDVSAGRLPAPQHLGPRCARWSVGEIRKTLKVAP